MVTSNAPGSLPSDQRVDPHAGQDEEEVELSPFIVGAEEDADRYRATSTLAGTRVRTDLKDIASSISVVTSQFLQDTGSRNAEDLLVYTTNTEVGGVQGNWAGVGNMVMSEATDINNLDDPGANTRIRGLDSADRTRDYFPTDIAWDAYNTGRIDMQRGPNSVLFGLGSPAGIINASVNRATFENGASIEARFGSFGTMRGSFDCNQVLIDDRFAVRVDGLADDTKYRQTPAHTRDRRLFVAARWDPAIFRDESAHTSLRANYEHGQLTANRPRVLPPDDRITPFFDAQAINRQTWDGWYAWLSGILPSSGLTPITGVTPNPWMDTGDWSGTNPIFIYDSPSSTAPATFTQGIPGRYWGLASDGTRDGGIRGLPSWFNNQQIRIASFGTVARNIGAPVYPLTELGYWKKRVLTDPSVFDFLDHLLDGPSKESSKDVDAWSLALEQTWLDQQLGFELIYDRQKHDTRNTARFGDTAIAVDIRANQLAWPWAYPDQVAPNPYAGAAYVTGDQTGGESFADRENVRGTLFGEVRASEFLASPRWSALVGRHLFTGLYSRETYEHLEREWDGTRVESGWADATGDEELSYLFDSGVITYLSGDLRGRSSASGLDLPGLTAVQSPHGPYRIPYFDSHWNAPTVDPGAAWWNPVLNPGTGSLGANDTQSENPFNYAGWVDDTFTILNADHGDEADLTRSAARTWRTTESYGLTWQGFLWDDTLVATAGWRHDERKQRAGSSSRLSPTSSDGIADPNPGLEPLDPETGVASDSNATWGLVLHTPRALRDKLPAGFDFSLAYSDGRNARVENRYGFDGEPLPNAEGRTRDFSIIASTLENRLQLKATWYETTVEDANLSSVTTQTTTLGYNTHYLYNLESWGTAGALIDIAGMSGDPEAADMSWFWSWAVWDSGWTDFDLLDSQSPAFQNHPSTARERAAIASWMDQMMPQSWFDAFGIPIDVAKAKAGDYAHAIAGGDWQPILGPGVVQALGSGRVNGASPTGTVDNRSEGVELELVGQPLAGWNLSINASRMMATQTALGRDLVDFIEHQHAKFESPAGDLRLWWGESGDTIRSYYDRNIWGPYLVQKNLNGKMVPEMAPWRFNLATNYDFQAGALKGMNVGLGYRWEDGIVLGYPINDAQDGLDIDHPYWGESKDAVDLWIGYEHSFSEKLAWRIQANVRNVGDDPHLEPITVQPDGSPSVSRIVEGMTWQVTNTLSF